MYMLHFLVIEVYALASFGIQLQVNACRIKCVPVAGFFSYVLI